MLEPFYAAAPYNPAPDHHTMKPALPRGVRPTQTPERHPRQPIPEAQRCNHHGREDVMLAKMGVFEWSMVAIVVLGATAAALVIAYKL